MVSVTIEQCSVVCLKKMKQRSDRRSAAARRRGGAAAPQTFSIAKDETLAGFRNEISAAVVASLCHTYTILCCIVVGRQNYKAR